MKCRAIRPIYYLHVTKTIFFMKKLGLIGFPLSHSFSKRYFNEKFAKEGLAHAWYYELFAIEKAEKMLEILRGENFVGMNVTIPYKETIIPFMHELDETAQAVGAVNCIKISYPNGKPYLKGYNTDYYGFQKSLLGLLEVKDNDKEGSYAHELQPNFKALILGTGGAAKAVAYALKQLNIPYKYVSRKVVEKGLTYDDLTESVIAEYSLLINTTPLGMTPNTEGCPNIAYEGISNQHFMYDLVYNPEITAFMKRGLEKNAKAKSGLDMLYFQAEKGWEIWNQP
jgi:shikimate dehydrogenase